ncbi:hypothetical protein R0290_27310 [Burkholderia semiarida]|uniref:hypothetical protein n=1 Tax=Burkholderia TaxID=32008 RepID=UPI00265F88B8|nr:hypothetical protein [Burkholderia sp. AU44665]MDN7697490.1 hypothetical protein [Burkholderia sp. AU44665]
MKIAKSTFVVADALPYRLIVGTVEPPPRGGGKRHVEPKAARRSRTARPPPCAFLFGPRIGQWAAPAGAAPLRPACGGDALRPRR